MNGGLLTTSGLESTHPNPAFSFTAPTVQTGDFTDKFRSNLHGAIRSAPIWQFLQEKKHYRFVNPIMISIREDEGFFFAENETLRLVGSGTNPEEALADFRMHLAYFHQYYSEMPYSRLTGEAARLKQVFETIFIEEQ